MDEGLAKIRHERSVKDFPFLKLEDNEYVEYAFKRAKIWLRLILGGLVGGLILILLAFLLVLMGEETLDATGVSFLYIILGTLLLSVFLAGVLQVFLRMEFVKRCLDMELFDCPQWEMRQPIHLKNQILHRKN